MEEKGTLYFFTGLAGAGKSTIGGLFYERLKKISPDALLMDGHLMREATIMAGAPRDYSLEARRIGAWNSFRYFHELTEEGKDVVACSMSLFDEIRSWNRANFQNYREIYLKVPMRILRTRRVELYSGNEPLVVGLDLSWDEPKQPDIIIENDGTETPEEIVDRLWTTFGLGAYDAV